MDPAPGPQNEAKMNMASPAHVPQALTLRCKHQSALGGVQGLVGVCVYDYVLRDGVTPLCTIAEHEGGECHSEQMSVV